MTDNTENAPIVITITLPVDGSAVGELVGSKGGVGVVRRFPYAGVEDVANAVQVAAWDLVGLEIEPPVVPVEAE